MPTNKTRLTICIDPPFAARLKRFARATRQSVSGCVEKLLRESLEESELAVSVLSDPVIGQHLLKAFGNVDFIKGMAQHLGEELTDEQLELFSKRLSVAAEPGAVKLPPHLAKLSKSAKKK